MAARIDPIAEASRRTTETPRTPRTRCQSTRAAPARTPSDTHGQRLDAQACCRSSHSRTVAPSHPSHLRTSQPSVPAVPLVHPVASLRAEHVAHSEADDVLGLFVAKLGGQNETQWGAVFTCERPAVHLVAQQR